MKKLLVLLISVLIIFSVIPFTASATELNLPETTPLIVKEAILNGDITGTTPIRNLQICDKIYNAFKNFETTVDYLLGIKTPIKKQKILYFQFRYEKSADIINDYLDDGWVIKEMQTHPLQDQHPEGVVIIEKTIK